MSIHCIPFSRKIQEGIGENRGQERKRTDKNSPPGRGLLVKMPEAGGEIYNSPCNFRRNRVNYTLTEQLKRRK